MPDPLMGVCRAEGVACPLGGACAVRESAKNITESVAAHGSSRFMIKLLSLEILSCAGPFNLKLGLDSN